MKMYFKAYNYSGYVRPSPKLPDRMQNINYHNDCMIIPKNICGRETAQITPAFSRTDAELRKHPRGFPTEAPYHAAAGRSFRPASG